MSQENVEAFKRGLEAGNRGDVEALLEELDPEVEWHNALLALLRGEQAVFRGHDGVREMIRDLNEAFDEIHIEMTVMDAGVDGDVTPPSGCPPSCGIGDEAVFLRQGVFTP